MGRIHGGRSHAPLPKQWSPPPLAAAHRRVGTAPGKPLQGHLHGDAGGPSSTGARLRARLWLQGEDGPPWADAISNLWAAYWYAGPDEEKEVPNGEPITAELEQLTKLDKEGLWDRDSRTEIEAN